MPGCSHVRLVRAGQASARPSVLFVNGFNSTYTASRKVSRLSTFVTEELHTTFLTYDHAGHGPAPATPLRDATLTQWREDLRAVVACERCAGEAPVGYYPIYRPLVDSIATHALPPKVACPVALVHGTHDSDVGVDAVGDWASAQVMQGAPVSLTWVPGGDHRLSAPAHLDVIELQLLTLFRHVG
ncbi:hypothetical protein SPRG_10186 [Saprolegnia parasitica CBS 223.65]|uniref:AB hydrolase-1 domain-containing protein n=1 Tax=Saprolegnia parasitica (strain CBS 223.65) TaxID=695850 RepID=A0A067C2B0_SAPPC|nr:hypothetical protein SPRG_10186 [Saprolegnia parasitica CBS 223.65]KDO24653.1 hypothetical protein SPRG_10186 [Saprolegnia parasitica CBS 223.65]|eukprot:XP_012204721.1 hypothetical protein SPRG_10186 [Saprolegnia parasitica CBS 223.65]